MPMQSTAAGQPAGPVPITAATRTARLRAAARRSLRASVRRGQSLGPELRRISYGTLLRRHWLLAVLLAAGLVLRAATQIAYRPALFYIDSVKYLYQSGGSDPVGYRVLLDPLTFVGNLDLVAVVQHLLGLAMAVALYVLLLRRGVPRWLAALAAAPILLDGYQLQIEQTIMPDVMFEALIVAGLVIFLWNPRPRRWMIVAGGLAFGACAPVRQVSQILILPAVIFVLAVIPGWRHKLSQAAVLCAAFALPILAYCSANLAVTGHFRLAYTGVNEIYGRLVLAANCHALALPAYERALCPTRQQALRLGIDGLEHSPDSPLRLDVSPPDMTFSEVISNFNRRMELQDPAAVLAAIGRDAVKLFAVQRIQDAGDTPISRWQFQNHYPFYGSNLTSQGTPLTRQVVATAGRRFGGGGPVAVLPLARFLRAYQLDGGYTPGPLLLAATLLGLLGSVAVVRRRATPGQRDLTTACLLIFTTGAAIVLAADVFQFSWRYQLPALVTLPPAGALGLTLVIGYVSARRRTAAPQQTAPQDSALRETAPQESANGESARPAEAGADTAIGTTPAAGPATRP